MEVQALIGNNTIDTLTNLLETPVTGSGTVALLHLLEALNELTQHVCVHNI